MVCLLGLVLDIDEDVGGGIKEEFMGLVADLDDFFIELVASAFIAVLVSDALDEFKHSDS